MAQDLICGRQAARALDQALRSPDSRVPSIQTIYISESFPAKWKRELSALLGRGPVKVVPSSELSRMTDLRHQGIVVRLRGPGHSGAYARRTDASVDQEQSGPEKGNGAARMPGGETLGNAPEPTEETASPENEQSAMGALSSLPLSLKDALTQRPGLYVMLDRIQDEQNLGSIARSAEALGAKGLIVTGKGARPGSVATRVSAGATLLLPIFVQSGSQGVIKTARQMDYWVLGADQLRSEEDPDRKEKSGSNLNCMDLRSLPHSSRMILVIGSEGDGMKSSLLSQCDYSIFIPLKGKTASLNAGVAAAILIERLLEHSQTSSGPE
ncbi:MAG: RNA methyltransferase [Leptospiraceae bacterium]|nr:RNA methyltransferase [Leptospiraceae bacterium]